MKETYFLGMGMFVGMAILSDDFMKSIILTGLSILWFIGYILTTLCDKK